MRLRPPPLPPLPPLLSLATLLVPLVAVTPLGAQRASRQPQRPNIVLIFPDNLGWGEVGAYGSVRGVPTPHIDSIAAQGARLDNFNVEFSCTVSRAALMTGRYAIRTGATQGAGFTLWEVTIAEALKGLGYATALFGKWHLGGTDWVRGRTPVDQGFDEWYGIPNTSNEAQWMQAPELRPAPNDSSFIWEQKTGEAPRRVSIFDTQTRRLVDREAARRGVAFIEKNARAGKPFFLYYPMTQIHFPTLAHPDFAGKTGAGDIGDSMADVDFNVGLITGALHRLGLDRNTLLFWCTDNGAEGRRPWRGTSGPWRGFYNTVMEGGVRTPCVVRWVGRIPRGQTLDGIIHELDLFPTIAAAVGGAIVPTDRPFDGINQLAYLTRQQPRSARESVLMFTGNQVRAVKWHDWKFHYAFQPEPRVTEPPLMRLFNLRSDPREETDIKDVNPWAIARFDSLVGIFDESVQRFPNVPIGARDPYQPPARK
ncbi:MAG: sulfatase-like hydrolase/transferase [Gemmatimonadaceae bacterium]|nr:sulfatase-like hydrolase/transferase [Gemmatimonadaceae bacterium]